MQWAAVGYMERGIAVIPIPVGEKNPGRLNWTSERWTVKDVPRLWNNGQCSWPSRPGCGWTTTNWTGHGRS